jgi:hypothetical protein
MTDKFKSRRDISGLRARPHPGVAEGIDFYPSLTNNRGKVWIFIQASPANVGRFRLLSKPPQQTWEGLDFYPDLPSKRGKVWIFVQASPETKGGGRRPCEGVARSNPGNSVCAWIPGLLHCVRKDDPDGVAPAGRLRTRAISSQRSPDDFARVQSLPNVRGTTLHACNPFPTFAGRLCTRAIPPQRSPDDFARVQSLPNVRGVIFPGNGVFFSEKNEV